MLLTKKQEEKVKDLFKHLETSKKEIEVNEDNTFKVIASNASTDRHGDSVMVEGWELENYMKNPVILLNHNWVVESIAGKATKVYVEGKDLIVEGVFSTTEKGNLAKELYNGGFLKTVSVGFIPKEYDEKNDNIITKQELLELSFVAIPANPEALSQDEKTLIKTFNKSLEEQVKEKSLSEMIKDEAIVDLSINTESNEHVYVCEIFQTRVIVNHYKYSESESFDKYLEYTYEIVDNKAILSDKKEVESERVWVEATKSFKENKKEIKEKGKLEELLAITSNIESKLLSLETKMDSVSSTKNKEVEKKEEVEEKEDDKDSIKALEDILKHFKNKNS